MEVDSPVEKPEEVEEPETVEDALDELQIAWDQFLVDLETGKLSKEGVVSKCLELLANERVDDRAIRVKEQCLYKLAKSYTEAGQFDMVLGLIQSNGTLFNAIPKAKTAKFVRNIIDIVATVPDSITLQIQLCKNVVDWCKQEKRTFLRQRIEAKLGLLLLQNHDTLSALTLITSLLSELKKLDDKQMLAEAHLTEARIHHALRNIPKAKAALTASRTSSHAIYVAPSLQAELDEMCGILQCEEGDYVTAFSYFLEAHDGYEQSKDTRALSCLQYMILTKVLQGDVKNLGINASSVNIVSDLTSLLSSSKVALKYSHLNNNGGGSSSVEYERQSRSLEAMIYVAKAAAMKSLENFKSVASNYRDVFDSDYLIAHNIEKLYDKMLEENLLKIIHPYSCVEIDFVAQSIHMPLDVVERKLSQMILDHRFSGILDQGKGELIIFPAVVEDQNMKKGLEIIANMTNAVQTLSMRAKSINSSTQV